jgi:hypothetical protein
MEEERRQPGSVPSLFMDHPPTPDRIVKSVEEIKEILPKRDEYLVTTSEFNDVKGCLRTVVANLKKSQKSGPTLLKRQPTDTTGTQNGGNNKTDGDDQPPVLRRRD